MTFKQKISKFLKETKRIIKLTKKPTKTELITTVKVSLIGIGIIGAIGFLLLMIKEYINF